MLDRVTRASSAPMLLIIASLTVGCAGVDTSTDGAAGASPAGASPTSAAISRSALPSPVSGKHKRRKRQLHAQRKAATPFPSSPDALQLALVASGVKCPTISRIENWKGEPYYARASSTWRCVTRGIDAKSIDWVPQIVMLEPSITGAQWIGRFPHSPAIYADSWVVIFPDSRQADRFQSYVNHLG